jgi:spore maturation protein CgeB
MMMDLINGTTSFEIVKSIAYLMRDEGVSDDWRVVSKYYSMWNLLKPGIEKDKSYDKKDRVKNIYIAYDAESFVAQNWGHVEIEYFERNMPPDLVIVFGKNSEKYYKKHGYETYLLPLGYDDYVHKSFPPPIEKTMDIVFCGTADKIRHSAFYPRLQACSLLANLRLDNRVLNTYFTNMIKYKDVPQFFSTSYMAFNDMVFPSPNMSCFEIPMGGTFMLVNNMIKEFPYPLKENKHYVIYKDYADLVIKANRLMDHKECLIRNGLDAQKTIRKFPLSASVRKMVDDLKLR